MKRIRITHKTEYHYHTPVAFGPHRALLRPREGHDVHIESSRLEIEPEANVRWLRDIYGNSIAVLTFAKPAQKLSLFSEIDVDLYDDKPIDCLIEPNSRSYPFQYDANEQVELIPYRLPSYPYDGPVVQNWLFDLYSPGQLINTFELLNKLNTRIYEFIRYAHREDPGVQLPCQTLALGTGSCRDYAVLMMEAARHWGFGARFVTGYIQMGEGQHGATHAWTEIYVPGAGWRGFDPTNNKLAGSEHVSVGVAREQEKASPLSGAWEGPPDAFDRMEVSVQVVSPVESANP
jgi:transglutaminase-like putative cysteine protease